MRIQAASEQSSPHCARGAGPGHSELILKLQQRGHALPTSAMRRFIMTFGWPQWVGLSCSSDRTASGQLQTFVSTRKPTFAFLKNPASSSAWPVFPCDDLLPQEGLVETGQLAGRVSMSRHPSLRILLMGMIYRCTMLVKTRPYCQETNAVISMHKMIARNHLINSSATPTSSNAARNWSRG